MTHTLPPSEAEARELAAELRRDVAATREVLTLRGDGAGPFTMLDRIERAAEILATLPPQDSSGDARALRQALDELARAANEHTRAHGTSGHLDACIADAKALLAASPPAPSSARRSS